MNCNDEIAVSMAIGFALFPLGLVLAAWWMLFGEPALKRTLRRAWQWVHSPRTNAPRES